MLAQLDRFLRDESAATAIEYGLIAALVSIAAIGALQGLGTQLEEVFGVIYGALGEVDSGGAG